MLGVMWFREDLRVHDNSALHHAAMICDDGIIGVYIIDMEMWKKHDIAACRVDFILRGLSQLRDELDRLNIPLIIRQIQKSERIYHEWDQLMQLTKAEALFFNHQYEINELRRDEKIRLFFAKKSIDCYSYDDQMILPPGSVLTKQREPFHVFTPFKRAWLSVAQERSVKSWPTPKKQKKLDISVEAIPTELLEFKSSIPASLWPAGEKHAHKRLKKFITEHLSSYASQRDFPALEGTSQLSPYLAAGMISARECFLQALMANHHELDSGNPGALTWISELIWRDFYKMILISSPRISMNQAFQMETEKLPWRYDEAQLMAWQEGKTGFPLIDAAMRQLNSTGWMHNRLRMVVAMFFAKNLFLDWRIGEKYFMNHLIDGDLSANNGGWQWCASTGTDAVPYFRVFNPILQSKRFDPNGEFIKKFCPELKSLDHKTIHQPPTQLHYPAPIIDLDMSRKRVIEAFKRLK